MDDFAWDREKFEWHEGKATDNIRDHGVSFPEATTVFADRRIRGPVFDEEHSSLKEDRWIVSGIVGAREGLNRCLLRTPAQDPHHQRVAAARRSSVDVS